MSGLLFGMFSLVDSIIWLLYLHNLFQVILVIIIITTTTTTTIIIIHELLLLKLNDCGLSAVYIYIYIYMSLFHSYLMNRMPYVHYGGALFAPYEVLSGVLQQSFLGPLFFNIFANDLCGQVFKSAFSLLIT